MLLHFILKQLFGACETSHNQNKRHSSTREETTPVMNPRSAGVSSLSSRSIEVGGERATEGGALPRKDGRADADDDGAAAGGRAGGAESTSPNSVGERL